MQWRATPIAVLAFVLGVGALGADDTPPPAPPVTDAPRTPLSMAPIVITPTRVEQSSFDLPVSIDVLGPTQIQGQQPQVNLSETLVRVPGVVAQNRQNYAQDLQISSRGFGARSTFGVRGIRLFSDDIPATSPDGQGQAATFDLNTAKRIEVMRGPFSALYGNSSGGVISLYTEDGPPRPTITADAEAGTFGTTKYGIKFGDTAGPLNYIAHASRFDTDGFREHSAATRDQVNSKFNYALSDNASLTLVATALHQPDTQDPLGLTRAQLEADRRQAGTGAVQFNTRKSIGHDQEGLIYEQRLSAQSSVRLLGYVGNRQVTQFLAVPLAQQQAATSSGGVVDLDRQFQGIDARFTHRTSLASDPLTFTIGAAYDNQDEHRQGFINNNGISGALKRDEDDNVHNVDQYAQAEWRFAPRWSATLGVRHSEVKFDSVDHFIAPGNGDDSGSVTYKATNPIAGLLFNLTPTVNLYANAGRGFETPTFAELAYKPSGASGLNFALQPSISSNYEVGVKAFLTNDMRLNVALFQIDTKNEIVVASNSGGRSTFQNAGRSQRRGAEALLDSNLGGGFGGYLALAYVNAEYRQSFLECVNAPPCNVAAQIVIPAGSQIAGVPKGTAYGELSWKRPSAGFETAVEARWSDKIFVNDANTDAAGSYAIASWRAGFGQNGPRWGFKEFVRIDNLFDRDYVGSVIVNEANARYFEPAPGRTYLIGLQGRYQF